MRGSVGLALFIAGATQGLMPAAASRVAEALTQHALFVRRIRAAADTSFAAIYRCYAPSAAVTAAAILPSVLLMQRRGWPDELPVGEFVAAIAAGVLLWLAAVHLVRHELRTELRTVVVAVIRRVRR